MAASHSSFAGKGVPPPAPADFDDKFVRMGRLECEAHYRTERITVDAWLRERGKQRLIEERARHIKSSEDAKLNRRDLNRILSTAYPVPDGREVSPIMAQCAANHLRICRNGGWRVSRMPDGLWRLGLRVVSAAELVEVAKAKGFQGEE